MTTELKRRVLVVIIALLSFALLTSFNHFGQINAQADEHGSLAMLLQRLVDEKSVFTIWFMKPINGKDWWDLPSTEKDENGVEIV